MNNELNNSHQLVLMDPVDEPAKVKPIQTGA